jgi:hypothetical protein
VFRLSAFHQDDEIAGAGREGVEAVIEEFEHLFDKLRIVGYIGRRESS